MNDDMVLVRKAHLLYNNTMSHLVLKILFFDTMAIR
jgi:hypothetical protein